MTKMRSQVLKLCLVALVVNMIVCLDFATVRAEGEEEDRPTANIYVDVLNQYIFRGVAFSDDSAVFQPSMTASYKGFSVNIWGNLDTDEKEGFGDIDSEGASWNETDFTASYSHAIYGDLSGTVGMVYYSIVGPDSIEVFGGLSYAFPWFTVALTAYREVRDFPGWWVQFDISRNIALPWYGMSVDLGASFGYQTIEDNDTLLNLEGELDDFSAPVAGTVTAALNIPFCKYFSVSPRVGVAFPLSEDGADRIEAVSWDQEETHVFGGIRLSASF